jgi:hypothetical protein
MATAKMQHGGTRWLTLRVYQLLDKPLTNKVADSLLIVTIRNNIVKLL